MHQLKLTNKIHRRKQLSDELHGWWQKEELLWWQRSKSHFLQLSNRNSGRFYKRASVRQKRNSITELKDVNGNFGSDQKGLGRIVTNYFKESFMTSNPTNLKNVLNVVNPRAAEEIDNSLYRPYSEDEVFQALGQMHPGKSLAWTS